MREIKFRAWHKEQGKMYSATELGEDQLTLMPDGRGFANISGDKLSLSRIDNGNKMIPLQYTGLKDRNGKEIYEGDILRFENLSNLDVVEAIDGGWNPFIGSMQTDSAWHYEVIGNIYENPELLK